MKQFFTRTLLIIVVLSLGLILNPVSTVAQESGENESVTAEFSPSIEYHLGIITAVLDEEERDLAGTKQLVQTVKARLLQGPDKGKEVELSEYIAAQTPQKVKTGDKVIILKNTLSSGTVYYISDRYRLTPFIFIFGIFLALAIVFARLKGFMAILGLGVSLLILVYFIIPQILAGRNPLLISIIGALIIGFLSLYLAHGFNKRTTLALVSTLLTLAIAAGLAILFVNLTHLSGLGSEEAFYLQLGPVDSLNLKGLLLGGIIIGTLGVLDDVTTSQIAAVAEIQRADPTLSFHELYSRGLIVGREHIASLVNTLVLAYAGASFPLFLLFTMNQQQPLWVKLNNEIIAEEVIRTLVGSCALIFAVPISTFLAAFFFEGQQHHGQAPTHVHHH